MSISEKKESMQNVSQISPMAPTNNSIFNFNILSDNYELSVNYSIDVLFNAIFNVTCSDKNINCSFNTDELMMYTNDEIISDISKSCIEFIIKKKNTKEYIFNDSLFHQNNFITFFSKIINNIILKKSQTDKTIFFVNSLFEYVIDNVLNNDTVLDNDMIKIYIGIIYKYSQNINKMLNDTEQKYVELKNLRIDVENTKKKLMNNI